MKKADVHIGHVYVAKISNQLTRVRIDSESMHGGWNATNLQTNKKVRIKSPAKLRGRTPKEGIAEESPEVVELPATAETTKTAEKTEVAAAKKLGCLAAAGRVLQETGQAMTCPELIEAMAAKGYWISPNGKTPAQTLYAAILREIKTKNTRFQKTARGKFALAE